MPITLTPGAPQSSIYLLVFLWSGKSYVKQISSTQIGSMSIYFIDVLIVMY